TYLAALRAPAAHHTLHSLFLPAAFVPQFDEARVFRRRALSFFQAVEAHADRDRDAFAADDAFAVAEGGDRIEEAARAFGHGGFHERLVAVVVEAHGDDRAALRQHTFGKIGRALGDEAEADAVLAAFLGDAAEDHADRRPVRVGLVGHVAVRFLADQKDRPRLLLPPPDREVEHQTAQHGDHGGGDV